MVTYRRQIIAAMWVGGPLAGPRGPWLAERGEPGSLCSVYCFSCGSAESKGTHVTESSTATGGQQAPKLDTTVPQTARIWNYWLGWQGQLRRPIARWATRFARCSPRWSRVARAERTFLRRAVRFLAGEAGIRQFLDVGTGLPTADNTHEVAQAIAPESRIVYVDNDPLVLVHARALLTSTPEGVTDYIDADVRDQKRSCRRRPDPGLCEAYCVDDAGHP